LHRVARRVVLPADRGAVLVGELKTILSHGVCTRHV
jgi:hypothetical protein